MWSAVHYYHSGADMIAPRMKKTLQDDTLSRVHKTMKIPFLEWVLPNPDAFKQYLWNKESRNSNSGFFFFFFQFSNYRITTNLKQSNFWGEKKRKKERKKKKKKKEIFQSAKAL